MSKSQQPPLVPSSQASPSDQKDEDGLLTIGAHRALIGRSNSAPQAQNRLKSSRSGVRSKFSAGGKSSGGRQLHLPTGEQNIPTLSDGVILVNHEQSSMAAAYVLSSHDYTRLPHLGGNYPSGSARFSSATLGDSNHLSYLNCGYSEKTLDQHADSEDVWQLREKSPTSRRLDADSSGSNQSMPGKQHHELRDIPAQRIGKYSSQGGRDDTVYSSQGGRDDTVYSSQGGRDDTVTRAVQGSSASRTVTNGAYALKNGAGPIPESLEGQVKAYQALSSDTELEWHESDAGSHHRHHPYRQALYEVTLPSELQRKMYLVNVKEKGYARLQEELMKAQKALEMKDEEVDELKGIRERLMKEVSDFTASLFEEVNSQLNEAAVSEQHARKQLFEANSKIEVLSAEVSALKDLVLTSTPSSPNKHLHPQIDTSTKKDKGGKPFWKTHRRSTSHHQLTQETKEKEEANEHHSLLKELDTGAFDEFQRWRLQPTTEFIGQFFARVEQEDIQPCLNFKNKRLADRLLESVRSNSLSIEPIPGHHSYPRKCCLSESHKLCNYKIKFEGDDDDNWYSISQMSRNRIAAVCDLYSYLRYIVQGLVKCSDKDMFAELVRLRDKMAQARLGLI